MSALRQTFPAPVSAGVPNRVLAVSTTGFTLMFAAWLMFGILGIPISKEFGLDEVQFGWLAAVAILSGSIFRLNFGLMADRYGGRRVFIGLLLVSAAASWLTSRAESYGQLLVCGFLVGLAGNSFTAGIAWNSAWFPAGRQGYALGVFGAGNVGASVTKFAAPVALAAIPAAGFADGWVPGGWRFVPFLYAGLLAGMAAAVWALTPADDRRPARGRATRELLRPLRFVRVWRFGLYYVIVFGAYVALSVWLPRYYMTVFDVSLTTAALLTALFIFPASLLRPLGGWMSDRFGARPVMYGVLGLMVAAGLPLSLPDAALASVGVTMSLGLFTVLVFLIGTAMGLGKAAVFKYIPQYYPHDVGAVGGIVGLLGAVGGFVLPMGFAYVGRWTGCPQTAFAIVTLAAGLSLVWLHCTVRRMGAAMPSVACVPSMSGATA